MRETERTPPSVDIILAAQKGDKEAFGVLARHYQRPAYALSYALTGRREEALECVQDGFFQAYRAIKSFDASRPFYPWLHRIIRNICLNLLRRRRNLAEVSLDELRSRGVDVAREDDGPAGSVFLDELHTAITSAMARLSPEHREVIALRHFEEMTYEEMASCLGIPKGTVMSRLHAARTRMRVLMNTQDGLRPQPRWVPDSGIRVPEMLG